MDGLVIFLVCLVLCVLLILMMVAEKCSDEVFEVVKCVFGHLGSFGDWCFDKLQVRRDSKSGERDAYVYADSFKDGVTYTSKEVSNGVERDVAWFHSVPLSNGGISNLLFFGVLPALCVVYWLWFFLSNSIVPAWDIQDISFTCVVSLMISAILSGLGIFIGLTRVISPARISVPDPYALGNEIMVKSNPKYYKWVIKVSAASLVGALYLFNFCGFGDVLIKDFGDSGLGKGFSSIRFYPRSTEDALMDAVQYVYNKEERNEQQKPQSNSFNGEQTEYYKYYLYGESGGEWEAFKVKIIFGKKDIKVIDSERTCTFIIVGSPKYDEYNDCTTYNVYYSDNANKDISEITRYKDRTHIQYIPECGEYEIYQKNEPEAF
ncbi:hypothetical protein [Dysgonomonas sp. 511]|uniref:hypothetical protein n=1 Tax=Dysgonomonas sp. 511 TaxID=2302930 RepID=UPI0016267DB5|nr:hypothetical protein [Dysgonomonas sp. 511]